MIPSYPLSYPKVVDLSIVNKSCLNNPFAASKPKRNLVRVSS